MPRQSSWTRETALQFFRERGLLTKPESEYTTAYVKRIASRISKEEQSGITRSAIEARKDARGLHDKTKAPLIHHVPNYKLGPLPSGEKRDHKVEQFTAVFPESADIRRLYNAVNKARKQQGKKSDDYTFVVHGVPKIISPTGRENTTKKPETYTFSVDKSAITDWLKDHPGGGDPLEFVNTFYHPQNPDDIFESVITLGLIV